MSEKLLQPAADRAERFADDLRDDLRALGQASPRIVSVEVREQGEKLILAAKAVADDLATQLRRNQSS